VTHQKTAIAKGLLLRQHLAHG